MTNTRRSKVHGRRIGPKNLDGGKFPKSISFTVHDLERINELRRDMPWVRSDSEVLIKSLHAFGAKLTHDTTAVADIEALFNVTTIMQALRYRLTWLTRVSITASFDPKNPHPFIQNANKFITRVHSLYWNETDDTEHPIRPQMQSYLKLALTPPECIRPILNRDDGSEMRGLVLVEMLTLMHIADLLCNAVPTDEHAVALKKAYTSPLTPPPEFRLSTLFTKT